jgi:hypothetical protein
MLTKTFVPDDYALAPSFENIVSLTLLIIENNLIELKATDRQLVGNCASTMTKLKRNVVGTYVKHNLNVGEKETN